MIKCLMLDTSNIDSMLPLNTVYTNLNAIPYMVMKFICEVDVDWIELKTY